MRADVSVPEDVEALSPGPSDLGGLGAREQRRVTARWARSIRSRGDEWTRAMDINVNGSVLPMQAVLPHFRRQRYRKIVQLSGGGATEPALHEYWPMPRRRPPSSGWWRAWRWT
ncbi:MAG: hypothetical protein R2712_18920 [Vicinamibacterales bacterium]